MSNSINISTARKLLEMVQGAYCSSGKSLLVFERMFQDGVLQKKTVKSRTKFYCLDNEHLETYLKTQFGILDLRQYLEQLQKKPSTRTEVLKANVDDKRVGIKPFQGFLIQSISPLPVKIEDKETVLSLPLGTSILIHEWQKFSIPKNCQVVIVENFENFKYLHKQTNLFSNKNSLFIYRLYDRHKSLKDWLKSIENPITYFGDWDFGGVKIFLGEFYRYYSQRCEYFIPHNLETILNERGNHERYYHQLNIVKSVNCIDIPALKTLTDLFHKYKRVLAQEVIIPDIES